MSSDNADEKVVKLVGIVREVKWSNNGGILTLRTWPPQMNDFEDISIPIEHYNTAAELRRFRNLGVELTVEGRRIIGIRTLPTTEADLE